MNKLKKRSDDINRRRFLQLGAMGSAGLALAACAGDGGEPGRRGYARARRRNCQRSPRNHICRRIQRSPHAGRHGRQRRSASNR